MKYLIGAGLLLILAALASAGFFLLRDGRNGTPKTNHMMRALAVRVGLSVLLFVCIWLSYSMGWIRPTGIPIAQ